MREYLDAKDDLYAGRTPSGKGGPTLRDICSAFMVSKRIDLDAGRLAPRTFVDYDSICRMVLDQLGTMRAVQDLGPTDFEKLYAHLARRHGLATVSREVTMVRSIFKYGFESDLIEKPVKFGPKFKAASTVEHRKAKAEHTNGKKLFAAEEIRRLFASSRPQLKAMILLGINAGMGNNDCACLPRSALDLDGGWMCFPRPKTGIARRVPLWPETVEAVRAAIAMRPEPADPADGVLVFLTRYGQPWVRYGLKETKQLGRIHIKGVYDNTLGKVFVDLLEELSIRRPGVAFYALRHTFETVAGGCKDQVAVDAIMGHVDASMAATYRHGIDDDRLRAVVNHVKAWLWPAESKPDGKGGQQDE